MKQTTWLTATALALTALAAAPAQAQRAGLVAERPHIAVTGEALVYVAPDRVEITFGIETSDMEIAEAKRKNSGIAKKTAAAAKACGVAARDIQTDHLSIEPRWHDTPRETFLGYFVRNSLVVTLTDTAQLEELLTSALTAGVTHVHGVRFQTTELRKHRDEARDLALKAAREKADRMAAALGQSAGPALQISEHGASNWGYVGGWGSGWGSGWGWGRVETRMQNVVQDFSGAPGDDTGGTVALGKIAVRASVSVTFELEG